MPATNPEEICRLFQQYMAEGDLESVLSVYDPQAVFLNQSREPTKDREGLRRELAPLVATRPRFDYSIKQVIEAGNIALMHTEWNVSGPQPMQVYAVSKTGPGAGSSATPLRSAESMPSDMQDKSRMQARRQLNDRIPKRGHQR